MLPHLRFTRLPIPELLVLVVAALTRFWRLGYHSIWFDEAVSLHWAGADLSYMWPISFRLVEEKHPPVYYTLLHLWQQGLELVGLGQNDAGLRALGALLGVLTVWGVLLLVGHTSGRTTALLAGLLVALSPVLIWYSQELRMFQPAATFIVWAAYCLVRAGDTNDRRARWAWWLGFILSMEAALYAYLFSAFVLPVAGITVFVLFWRRMTQRERNYREHRDGAEKAAHSPSTFTLPHPRARFVWLAEGVIALAMTGLLFLPLALNAWGVNADESDPGVAFANFSDNAWRLLRIFTVWRPGGGEVWTDGVLLILAVLVVAGVVIPWGSSESRRRSGSRSKNRSKSRCRNRSRMLDQLVLLVWIGGPLLVANVLLSRSDSIFAEDRYLIFMAPFVLWAVARGVVVLEERAPVAGWLAVAFVVGALLTSLPRLWTPALARENWRAAAAYIADYQDANPDMGSAVIAHIGYTHRALDWYLQQRYPFAALPVFGLFSEQIASEQADDVIGPPVMGIPKELGAVTLWLAQSHLEGVDDAGIVQSWLDEHFPLITAQSPAGVGVRGYALQSRFERLPTLAATATYPARELAPGLLLAACEVVTPAVSATDTELHPPSGWVHVRLWWQATEAMERDYLASVRVVDDVGVWGERLLRENEPLRRFPTSTWPVDGAYMRDEVDVNLNPATPTGQYTVMVGAQNANGQIVGETVDCSVVQIGR